ncbi:unnamed protein product [Blepharisma stoltei]|uniref:non-specific serine/threonine protein kinase n=1 Tax=Blepharisma stoltei TaxID=1481888 RepID=A0AAU9JXY6_9CILI|nr:unnamed protein product [Blepharisma stoltei]
MSLFESINSRFQGSYKFWKPEKNKNSSIVFKNKVFYKAKQGAIKSCELILIKNYLIKVIPDSINKITLLDWKIIEPFTEVNGDKERFGFSVGHRGCSRDFYVENEEKLNEWLDVLLPTCIMTDFSNDFSIVKEIGSGSFGVVYLALSNNDSKPYAVKAINKNNFSTTSSLNSVADEIKIMRMLDHPNIVKLHYVYEDSSLIYLVTDYVEGGNLHSRMVKKKVFNERTVSHFAEKMLGVLDYMSSLDIVHRDLKLENILMVSEENDYDFKIIDFGLAAEVTEGLHLRCGSPGYIAPEILRKHYYDAKADLFSLGVILYILLSGKMPFNGKNINDVLIKNREGKISFQHPAWKNVSKYASTLVLRLTEPLPSIRPTAREALQDSWLHQELNTTLPNIHPTSQPSESHTSHSE